jgi:hypothetical protein
VIASRFSLALLAALPLVACQPRDERPGLWLRGERVDEPVDDWSFSDAHPEIFVETRTWYGVPHSVTTVCASDGANLYVPSVFVDGGSFPGAKFWTRNVARDPAVRVKIGERVFEREAVLVEDAAERERALSRFAAKYPFWSDLSGKPEGERPGFVILRMRERGEA